MTPLPPGWAQTTLGELDQPSRPRVDPHDYPESRFIGLEHVEAHTMHLLATATASEMRSSAVAFKAGDVLYARLRPYLNKVCLPNFDGLCSGEFIVLSFPQLDARFAQHRINSNDFVAFASHADTGERPRVRFEDISPFPVALPPLREQQRIVAEIEKQFTRLEAAVASLARLRANLKRYRAATLAAAVTGKLVPTEATPFALGDLLAEPLANGRSPRTASSGERILRLTALRGNTADLRESRFGRIDPASRTNLRVRAADVLIARGSGSIHLVGRAGLVTTVPTDPVYFPDTMVRARPDPQRLDPRYLVYAWNSPVVRFHLERRARTTAGIQKLSQKDMEATQFPLPPLAEQRRIVTEVERRLSVIDELAAQVDRSLQRAARLRQAVLKRAFEGRLVPQDPSDEPASVLLERIRIQRAAEAAAAPHRTRSAKNRQKARAATA